MTRISNILVPVDFSAASGKAMDYGSHLALKFGAKLTAVHIIPPVGGFHYAFPGDSQEFERKALWEAKRRLPEEIPQAFREQVNTTAIVRCGEVREELLGIVENDDIDFIVMGTHGRRALERFFLGSVTEALLRRVSAPMLTVSDHGAHARSESPFEPIFRRVVYATDFSESGNSGLCYCANFVRTLGAHLTVLHVIDSRDTMAFKNNVEIRTTLLGKLKKLIKTECRPGLDVAAELIQGTPHREILKYAESTRADVIVVNLQSKALLERALLGSTAERIIRSSRIPILSVPVLRSAIPGPVTVAELIAT